MKRMLMIIGAMAIMAASSPVYADLWAGYNGRFNTGYTLVGTTQFGWISGTQTSLANVKTGQTQLLADIFSVAGQANKVVIAIRNVGPNQSSATDVYFDDGTLLDISNLIDKDQGGGMPGVDFTQDTGTDKVSPPELPGGNTLTPTFETSTYDAATGKKKQKFSMAADSDVPVMPNGVNQYEYLGIIFDLKAGKTAQMTYAALLQDPSTSGSLRIGLHVQGFADGGSASFVSGLEPTPVPIPGAALLGLLGFGLIGWTKKRFA
jgi:hypothetical protein